MCIYFYFSVFLQSFFSHTQPKCSNLDSFTHKIFSKIFNGKYIDIWNTKVTSTAKYRHLIIESKRYKRKTDPVLPAELDSF